MLTADIVATKLLLLFIQVLFLDARLTVQYTLQLTIVIVFFLQYYFISFRLE